MNYGKHQIFIGGEKQDVIGFISAFLDKIEKRIVHRASN